LDILKKGASRDRRGEWNTNSSDFGRCAGSLRKGKKASHSTKEEAGQARQLLQVDHRGVVVFTEKTRPAGHLKPGFPTDSLIVTEEKNLVREEKRGS